MSFYLGHAEDELSFPKVSDIAYNLFVVVSNS